MAVTLFAYRRGNTLLHRFPALLKLVLLMALCIYAFKGGFLGSIDKILSGSVIIQTVLSLIFSVTLFVLAGANFSSLKQLRSVLVLGFFMTVFSMMSFADGKIGIDKDGLASGVLWTIRFFLSTLAAVSVFETTSSLQIKEALECIENGISKVIPPFKKLQSALVISLAINFIPKVFATWNRVLLAGKARSPKKKGLILEIQIFFAEFKALFSCLLNQAETTRKAILNRENKK